MALERASAADSHVGLSGGEAALQIGDDILEARALRLVHGQGPSKAEGDLFPEARAEEVRRLGEGGGQDDQAVVITEKL